MGVDLTELVRGTNAEERLRDANGLVRRADYEDAVRSFIEYESKNRELEARVRALAETAQREHAARYATEQRESVAILRAEHLARQLAELELRVAEQAAELRRYQDALARAVAEFSALQKQVGDLDKELGDAKQSSRTASILAGVAAVTGVATIAHFLGEDEDEIGKKRRAAKSKNR